MSKECRSLRSGRILGQAEAAVEDLLAADPENPILMRSKAVMLTEFSDVYGRAGDSVAAMDYIEESLKIQRVLSARDPDNTDRQRGVSISLEVLGDLRLRTGDAAGALDGLRGGAE